MNTQKDSDFELWAKLLIRRKVPPRFVNLVDQEIIECAAAILKRGESFEVRLIEPGCLGAEGEQAAKDSVAGRIAVTPMFRRVWAGMIDVPVILANSLQTNMAVQNPRK